MSELNEGFGARLSYAETLDKQCKQVLRARWPGTANRRGTLEQDKTGIDYQVKLKDGTILNVDFKIRTTDYGRDLVLEYISSIEDFQIGWTVDPAKKTHFVIWYWADSKRWLCYSYDQLRRVAKNCAFAWLESFKQINNFTDSRNNFHSHAVCVPEATVDCMIEAVCSSLDKTEGRLQ